jgi:hypothetical protein
MAVEERTHRPANITIIRSEGLFGSATVEYRLVDNTTFSMANTADATAWDYSQGASLYHTVTFSDGQATAVVSVDIIDDLRTEPAEMFTLELVSTSAGRIDDTSGQASVNIIIGASDGPEEYVSRSAAPLYFSCVRALSLACLRTASRVCSSFCASAFLMYPLHQYNNRHLRRLAHTYMTHIMHQQND